MRAVSDVLFGASLVWFVGALLEGCAWAKAARTKAETDRQEADVLKYGVNMVSYAWVGLVLCGLAVGVRFWPW